MQKLTRRPQLFVLRIWQEELGNGNHEWRGAIECAATREMHYFREWSALLDFVRSSCERTQGQNSDGDVYGSRHQEIQLPGESSSGLKENNE